MKRNLDINKILRPLSDTPYQAYLSNAVQVADVLEWILEQVGEAEVWQTSFSISEEFLRRLFFIEKSGRVKAFHLVLDHKATNKTLKLWAFISQVIERTYLADNHSKILLVKSNASDTVSPSGQQLGHSAVDEQALDCSRCTTVCVVTSQNLTRGNRSESAFITTDKEIFATLHSQVDDLISNHSVPLNDLFLQRINSD